MTTATRKHDGGGIFCSGMFTPLEKALGKASPLKCCLSILTIDIKSMFE